MDFLLEQLPSVGAEELKAFGWNGADKSPNMVLMEGTAGLRCCRKPRPNSTDGIRAKRGLASGLHIWEIRWPQHQRGTYAAIGVGTGQARLQANQDGDDEEEDHDGQDRDYSALLGADEHSWGWDIVSRKCRHDGQEWDYPKGAKARRAKTIPERLFCILDMHRGTLAFATPTEHLGVAFRGLLLPSTPLALFPMVAAVFGHAQITIRYRGSPHLSCASSLEAKEDEMDDQLGELTPTTTRRLSSAANSSWLAKNKLKLGISSPMLMVDLC